jgi:N-acetylmuramoyl-L-alanine amidase
MSGIDRFNETQTFKLHLPEEDEGLKQYPNLCACLDPGHAESTGGKRSPYSLGRVSSPELDVCEYKFSRLIATNLKELLEMHGVDVFITTTEEMDGTTDVGLSTRANRANNYLSKSGKKGIFMSIHADADGDGSAWTSANGWTCYTTEGKTNSDILAECLYDAAEEIFVPKGLRLRTDKTDGDRDKEKDFTVIYKANMPAVLVENFFYTNIENTEYLLSDEGVNDILQVLLKGILSFAEKFYNM